MSMKNSNGTIWNVKIWVLQITRNFLMSWTTISLSKRRHWVVLLFRLPDNELIQYFKLARNIRFKHSGTLHSVDRWTASDVSEECTASIKTVKQFKKSSRAGNTAIHVCGRYHKTVWGIPTPGRTSSLLYWHMKSAWQKHGAAISQCVTGPKISYGRHDILEN